MGFFLGVGGSICVESMYPFLFFFYLGGKKVSVHEKKRNKGGNKIAPVNDAGIIRFFFVFVVVFFSFIS